MNATNTVTFTDVLLLGLAGIGIAVVIFLFVLAVTVLRSSNDTIERETAWLIRDTARLQAESSELRAMIRARQMLG